MLRAKAIQTKLQMRLMSRLRLNKDNSKTSKQFRAMNPSTVVRDKARQAKEHLPHMLNIKILLSRLEGTQLGTIQTILTILEDHRDRVNMVMERMLRR